MLRIAICEDDCVQSDSLFILFDAYRTARPGADMQAHAFLDGNELLSELETDPYAYDLFLLDIFMPGIDGITLARRLRTLNAETPLVFLTASADYALEAFSVSASKYLLKPVTADKLYEALDKAVALKERDAQKRGDGHFFMLPVKNSTVKVYCAEVIYVELSGRAIYVYMADGGIYRGKTLRVPFSSAVAPLLADGRFLHAHNSYVLNMTRVRELTPRSFIMENGNEISVPRNKYSEAKNKYFDFLSARGIGRLGG